MKRLQIIIAIFTLSLTFANAQDFTSSIDAAKIRERVKRISADEFEGRGPGNDGSKKAADYIAAQLKAAGVKPGNGKSYFQNVKLVGVKVDPATQLTFSGRSGESKSFKFGDDFVATTGAQTPNVSVDAEVVFMGYGVDAPLYKGAVRSHDEPFNNSAWQHVQTATRILWSTSPFAMHPNSNPLRWGTMYNFRFDADRPPQAAAATLSLYKPGTPASVSGMTTGPRACPADFDGNGDVAVPDIFAFLSAWFALDPRTDFDESGSVGVPDIFVFLAVWFSGACG
jgi:hypothetical protein